MLAILFAAYSVKGQSSSDSAKTFNTQLSFEIGPHLGYLKDLGFSPLNYRETGTLLSVLYALPGRNDKYLFTVDIDFTSGKLKTKTAENLTTPFIQGNIEVSLLWKLRKIRGERLKMFLGPQYNSYFQYMQWGEEMDSWNYMMVHGLNLKVLALYRISDKKRLQTSLSIPLLENFVRPPYNGFDQYIVENQEKILKLSFRGELASFNRYVAIDWRTTYQYAVSAHLDFIFGYLFRYQHVPGYNKVRHFQNQFTSGFAIKF
jgi:hypothetical protein